MKRKAGCGFKSIWLGVVAGMLLTLAVMLSVFVVVALSGANPVQGLAQDRAAQVIEPPPVPAETGALQAAGELLAKALADATFLPVAALFVVTATAITKKLLPGGNSAVIALGWQVAAWVAWILALHFGYGNQFTGWINGLTTVLTGLAGLAGSTLLATSTYRAAAARGAPLIGYQKTGTLKADFTSKQKAA